MVIFGANGDLTQRKLLPALYRLFYERRIPAQFAVIGNSRTELSDDQFRAKMREGVEKYLENSPFDEQLWEEFAKGLSYFPGSLDSPETFQQLKERLAKVAEERQTGGNVLFYLSTQPSLY